MDRSFPKFRLALLLFAIILGSALLILPTPASAAQPACGATISVSTTLHANVGPCSGNGLNITANNVVLNCAGHNITGDGTDVAYIGIHTSSVVHFVVENCIVSGFVYGFVVTSSSSGAMKYDEADNNQIGYQVELASTNDNLIGDSALKNGNTGYVVCCGAHNNKFVGDYANDNAVYGFQLIQAYGDTVKTSTANGNGLNGLNLYFSTGETITADKANGNAAYGFADNTSGSGTAGTSNLYHRDGCISNLAGGSSPTGLCKPQH
jgi:hypothetical protein